MGGNIFEFLTDHPFAAVIIGFSWLVIAFFIYKLLKKDIKGLSKDIKGLSKDIKGLKEFLIIKIEPIEKSLSNHITETKAEIKDLNKKLESKFDNLNSKMDSLLIQKTQK